MIFSVIRRKSAVERLAETKYNYIKSSPTPPLERDDNEKQRSLTKSLSTSALKPSLVILTQSPTILVTNSSVDCHQNQLNHSNIKSHQTVQSPQHTIPSPIVTTPQVVTRKRNPSLSSRLSSESSHNLEQQLRQLIADENEEQNSDQQLASNQNIDNKKIEAKVSVIKSVSDGSTVKPQPKERLKTTNQQILRQNPNPIPNVVPKQRTIFTTNTTNLDKTKDKIIVDNKKKTNNCILRYNSSHNNTNNNNLNKVSNNLNSKLINKPKPLTQPPLTPVHRPIPVFSAVNLPLKSTTTSSPSSRQMSISRSKSDVSNRLLVKRSKSKDEIERFFETLGLDSTVWDKIQSEATNSLISTPAHYFESCDSFESGDVRHQTVMSSGSSSSSSTDRHSTSAKPTVERQVLNTRLMQSRSCHALSSGTSIVEKNARVIKWLYNCRKAMV